MDDDNPYKSPSETTGLRVLRVYHISSGFRFIAGALSSLCASLVCIIAALYFEGMHLSDWLIVGFAFCGFIGIAMWMLLGDRVVLMGYIALIAMLTFVFAVSAYVVHLNFVR